MNKKIGRNDPCPCGSGKKYKQCCQKKDLAQRVPKDMKSRSIKTLGSGITKMMSVLSDAQKQIQDAQKDASDKKVKPSKNEEGKES